MRVVVVGASGNIGTSVLAALGGDAKVSSIVGIARHPPTSSDVEWRALMFHESTGQAAALYQATWIRQSGKEVVLVAPMPASIVPREPNAHKEASGRLGRALTRELKLLQAPAESPPARDVRVAIDRPFMMAVRRALDEAPLAQRISLTAASIGRCMKASAIFLMCARIIAITSGRPWTFPPSETAASPPGPSTMS